MISIARGKNSPIAARSVDLLVSRLRRKPVSDIAFRLGFADAAYFTHFFRREMGRTPTQFRATARGEAIDVGQHELCIDSVVAANPVARTTPDMGAVGHDIQQFMLPAST